MVKQDFKLNTCIRDGLFWAEAEHFPDNSITYAFYYYYNGNKIDQRWHTHDKNVVFPVNKNGVYYVSCFIKDSSGSVVSKRSEALPFYREPQISPAIPLGSQIQSMDISIFGSCVSRDLLEFDREKKFSFLLKSYIARQTIISAVSKSVAIEESSINLNSAFQRRMVLQDFRKDTFDLLKENRSEYLIIDLIDDRFLPARYEDSIVTFSSLLQQTTLSKHALTSKYVYDQKCNKYFWEGLDLDDYLSKFCSSVKELYPPKKVILHKAKFLPLYRNKQGNYCAFPINTIVRDAETNKRLEYMYAYLEKHLGSNDETIFTIDICDSYYASEDHKWGLASMHYCDEYYMHVLKLIYQKILADRKIAQPHPIIQWLKRKADTLFQKHLNG